MQKGHAYIRQLSEDVQQRGSSANVGLVKSWHAIRHVRTKAHDINPVVVPAATFVTGVAFDGAVYDERWLLVSTGVRGLVSRALLVALLVSAVPGEARADVLLLVDRLTFKYDVTVQALIYGANEEGGAEFIGMGPVEHFEGTRHGSTFGGGDHRWSEEIRSAPRTDYYSDRRFGQVVQGSSTVTGGNISYMALNAMMDSSGDMNQNYDYHARADLDIYWKFVVDSDVSLRLSAYQEEGSGSANTC